MRQATFKSLWVAVKDLLYTIFSSLYTGVLDTDVKLDVDLKEEDVEMPDPDEHLGI
jgi:hypothetical protein|tara:strand:+ start:549 stop:716 length:168 start_codon:yes stop_codon:yes gene_type:complete